MADLRQDYQQFLERGAEVIAIGPEEAGPFTEYFHRESLPFIGIPDPAHKIASRYGQKVNIIKFGRMPAMVVVDREGRVRYRHYGDSMSDIPKNEDILALLDDINKETK